MKLEEFISGELARPEKEILLMTHIVLGYPSLATNREVVAAMVKGGVELIELQIPFSEPMADGPAIVRANQEAIEAGIKVRKCFAFAAEQVKAHPGVAFLFMTYYNIVMQYGPEKFVRDAVEMGIKGCIIPDLPPEEGDDFLTMAREHGLDPILIYAPTSTEERMTRLNQSASGFIYCVARKGVTGQETVLDKEFAAYMTRAHAATDLPLAVGFGISNADDIKELSGQAEIGVIGTKTIKLVNEKGVAAVEPFIRSLRP
ncbi:MAG: tryptophan synthase subunit alpha [Thermodesulfobacteriota bacterium]